MGGMYPGDCEKSVTKSKAWTKEDFELAAQQGWELQEIWCETKKRIECQIFKDDRSKVFATDEAARQFVAQRMASDQVAQKAFQLVFASKIGRKK